MDSINRIELLTRRTRTVIDGWYAQCRYERWWCDETLCGFCAIGTTILHNILVDNGFNSSMVMGNYKYNDYCPSDESNHCWNEIELAENGTYNTILADITFSQFTRDKILVCNRHANVKTKMYNTLVSATEIDKFINILSDWPIEQKPDMKLVNTILATYKTSYGWMQ